MWGKKKKMHLKFEVTWQLHAGPPLSIFGLPVKKLKTISHMKVITTNC